MKEGVKIILGSQDNLGQPQSHLMPPLSVKFPSDRKRGAESHRLSMGSGMKGNISENEQKCSYWRLKQQKKAC